MVAHFKLITNCIEDIALSVFWVRNVNEIHIFDYFVNYILLWSVIELLVQKKRIAMQNLDVLMVVGKGLIIFKENSDKGEGGQKLQNLI